MSKNPHKQAEQLIDNLKGRTLPDKLREKRKQGVPVMMFGPPGVGKSTAVEQILDDDDFFADVRTSQLDPVDVRGLPRVAKPLETMNQKIEYLRNKRAFFDDIGDTDKAQDISEQMGQLFNEADHLVGADQAGEHVRWARPDFLPPIDRNPSKGIVFFDEINTASPAVQNTALQPFGAAPGRDRFIGPHRIPAGYWLVAAGNRAEDVAHVTPMSAPLRDRFHIINVEPNIDQWTDWAMKNDVHKHVIGFLNWRSECLYQPPSGETEAFPTPRSWVRDVSASLHEGIAGVEAFKGAVGTGPAQEMMAYLREVKNMPSIKKLLDGKETYDFKDGQLSICYAIMVEMAFRSLDDHGLIPKASKVAVQARPEHAAIFFSSLLKSDDDDVRMKVVQDSTSAQWAQTHKSLIRSATN